MDVVVICKNYQIAVYYCILSFSFLFQSQIDKSNSNTNNHKQIKIKLMFRIIKFKSVKTLNFITWKEKDHINQGGNTKIKPSYAFQCFSPGVQIRTLSQFGTGNQLFLKMLVCSVNSDISLTVHVAFMILQMSDFSRLALDVYVFKRYGNNIKKIPIKRGHIKAMVIVHFLRVDEV